MRVGKFKHGLPMQRRTSPESELGRGLPPDLGHSLTIGRRRLLVVPSAGFEPAPTAPEADALSPELRGLGQKMIPFQPLQASGNGQDFVKIRVFGSW